MSTTEPSYQPVADAMQQRVDQWDACGDGRALFLRCYLFMTHNVLAAIEQRDFKDPAWVNRLLHRFADYYFVALNQYEENPTGAPAVWQLAHLAACDPNMNAVQKLLAGVNAHINHDLVFALVDLLRPEWPTDDEAMRALRHTDHCHINDIIGQTIDVAQDQIIEPSMPVMKLVDDLMGGADELVISQLISHWRDEVWKHAMLLLETNDPQEIAALTQYIENASLETGRLICV